MVVGGLAQLICDYKHIKMRNFIIMSKRLVLIKLFLPSIGTG